MTLVICGLLRVRSAMSTSQKSRPLLVARWQMSASFPSGLIRRIMEAGSNLVCKPGFTVTSLRCRMWLSSMVYH